ncbi:MAG: HAD-IB family phosphatase [Gemmatimonadaceae bacterium]
MTTAYQWDFFIAHSSANTAEAESLFELLKDHARVFLDSKSIALGDEWDATIMTAHRASFVTIVIVSTKTERAYYQRAEIAAAIAMARKEGSRHRVVPLYLDIDPSADTDPYGLALKHGLRISDRMTLAAAAERLLALLDSLMPTASADAEASGPASISGTGVLHQPASGWKSPVIDNPHRFKLATFDFDGTLLRGADFDFSWEVVWTRLGFAHGVQAELRREYRRQTEKDGSRAARVRAYREWCEKAVARFRTRRVTRDQLREFCAPLTLTNNCREALKQLRAAGVVTAIISGGINTFVEDTFPDYKEYFDFLFINELTFAPDGLLTGVKATEFDFQGKAEALDLISARIGSTPGEAVFVGDHFNDEAIMLRVDKAIAYPPKDTVVEGVLTEAVMEDDLLKVVPHVLVV